MIKAKEALQLYVKKQFRINQDLLSEIFGYIEQNANRGNAYYELKGDIPQFVHDVLISNGYVVKRNTMSGGDYPDEGEVISTRISWYTGILNEQP